MKLPGLPPGDHHWGDDLHVAEILDRVDHIVNLPRLGKHGLNAVEVVVLVARRRPDTFASSGDHFLGAGSTATATASVNVASTWSPTFTSANCFGSGTRRFTVR